MSRRRIKSVVGILLFVLLLAGVLLRAGLTRAWVEALWADRAPRPVQLRVWDWWSPSANEEYGQYFDAVERIFEERNPDIDLVYQIVPFGNYVQKLSTAMVGRDPPDVFQSSVYWAEGFYQRGMLRPLDDLLEQNRGEPPAQRVGPEAFLWQQFWHVTIPMLRNTLVFVAVMTIIGSFQVFTSVYIMTSGGPERSTEVIAYTIFINAFAVAGQMGYASALAWLLFAVISIFVFFQMRVFRSRRVYDE